MLKDNPVLLFCRPEYAHRPTELGFCYVIANPLEKHDRRRIRLAVAFSFKHFE